MIKFKCNSLYLTQGILKLSNLSSREHTPQSTQHNLVQQSNRNNSKTEQPIFFITETQS